METEWLVENGKVGSELRYRTMKQGSIVWTIDVNEALRFVSRVDAEKFSEEDEEAWKIEEVIRETEHELRGERKTECLRCGKMSMELTDEGICLKCHGYIHDKDRGGIGIS